MELLLRHFFQKYKTHFRDTIRLSGPVIIGQLGIILMGVVDNVMIGQLGYEALSAASLSNSIFFILVVFGMGITFAISPLVAEADAAEKPENCGKYLRQGVWVSIATSLGLGIIMYIATLALPLMGQPEADVILATPYLHILNISVLPMLLFLNYKQFTDGLSFTRPAMYITILGLGFNALTNWLLIFGNLGFPRMELNGAGYATLGSRIFMFLLMWGYVVYQPRFKKYSPAIRWKEFDWKIISKIMSIGFPSGLQYFFEVGAFGGAVIMIGWMGMVERSAHQIVINLASITYMITSGISAGAAIRVGNALGRKDFVNVRHAGLTGVYLAAAFMIVASIVFVAGRFLLPSFYVDDVPVLELAASLMIIAAFFQTFDGVQAVGIGILRGMQDVRIPTILTFIAYWAIALPMGYIVGFLLNQAVEGVWYGFVAGLGFSAFALTYRFWTLTGKSILENMLSSSETIEKEKTVLPVKMDS